MEAVLRLACWLWEIVLRSPFSYQGQKTDFGTYQRLESCGICNIIWSFLITGELDDKMKWLKNFDRLLEIQRNMVWPSVLEMDPKQFFPEFLKVSFYSARNKFLSHIAK